MFMKTHYLDKYNSRHRSSFLYGILGISEEYFNLFFFFFCSN